jgi:hypothetical protein
VLNAYEKLLAEADEQGLNAKEKPLLGHDGRIKGNKIAIRQNMTTVKKSCVLAEELGHHYTTIGNILDQDVCENIRQERKARLWAYNNRIGLMGIVKAYQYGCCSLYDMAEYLEVTEQFLLDTLEAYHLKYGQYAIVDNYIIYFEPCLMVGNMNSA